MLRISDGWSEVGGEVRAALDQGGSRGTSLHGQAPEAVGRSPLVPRKDAWDRAPLAASSRGGLASCGGMRREPDVRQELVERAGTLMRDFAAMDEVRSFARFGVIDRRHFGRIKDSVPVAAKDRLWSSTCSFFSSSSLSRDSLVNDGLTGETDVRAQLTSAPTGELLGKAAKTAERTD